MFKYIPAQMTDATAVSEEKTQDKQLETTTGNGGTNNAETDKNKTFITEVRSCIKIL